jgi:hypothetical protein
MKVDIAEPEEKLQTVVLLMCLVKMHTHLFIIFLLKENAIVLTSYHDNFNDSK